MSSKQRLKFVALLLAVDTGYPFRNSSLLYLSGQI